MTTLRAVYARPVVADWPLVGRQEELEFVSRSVGAVSGRRLGHRGRGRRRRHDRTSAAREGEGHTSRQTDECPIRGGAARAGQLRLLDSGSHGSRPARPA